jgi:hypothetical protein
LINRKYRGFPFQWALPTSQLAFCIVLLWPLRGFYAWQLQVAIHAYRAPGTPAPSPNFPKLNAPIILDPLPMNLSESATLKKELREVSAAALNLPAGLVQAPYAILSSERREWRPRGVIFFQSWRAVSWPILCIPFWWLAGLSIEALSAARHSLLQPRIGWVGTCVAVLVFVSGAGISIGTLVDTSTHDDWTFILLGVGAALWALLGGSTIAARVVQWRIRKRLRLAGGGEAATQPTV